MPKQSSSTCIFKPCQLCRTILRSTIYSWRHSPGSTVSRVGLWEFFSEINIIQEDGLVAIGHSEKHSLYHLIVRRAKGSLDVTQVRKLRAVYTIFRDKDKKAVDKVWIQVATKVNGILPFLDSYLYLTEIRVLQVIMTASRDHPTYTSAHVAAKLQLVTVFDRKNSQIIKHINDRVKPIGQTPLMIAVQSQNLVLVKQLVECGASLLPVDYRVDSILHYAALSNNLIFKYLVDRVKAAYSVRNMLRCRNSKGYQPLHWCCYSGHIENVIDLLKLSLPCSMLIIEPQPKTDSEEDSKHRSKETLKGVMSYKENENGNSSQSSSSGKGQKQKSSASGSPSSNPPVTTFLSMAKSAGSDGSIMSTTSSHDEMVTFTNEMIGDLDTHEIILGGSPIHWVKTRRVLETLLEKTNLPLDSKNFKHETPLHVMTRKRRLKCAVILLARGVDVSVRDNKGNTPLHRAVQKEDISMVQGLIAFDADINGLNNRYQTPRHIAATKDSPIAKIIVNVLHRVGAKRCPPGRKKCTEDCAHESTGIGTPFPKWANYENESPYEDFMNVRGGDEANLSSKMDSKVRSSSSPESVEPARLICFDGGGTRGLFTCCALIEIERRLQKPLREYFEWFIGTSSGSLIASLIVLGTPLIQIRSMFYQFKDRVFTGTRPYDSVLLEKLMQERMGPSTKMHDIKGNKKLLITAVATHHNPAELYLFRNIPTTDELLGRKVTEESDNATTSDPNLVCPSKWIESDYNQQLIWQACRASGAAPSYFKAFGPFIDGGILANNPTLDGLSEFFHYNQALVKAKGKQAKVQKVSLLLSMGTGRAPIVPARLVDIGPIMASSIFTLGEAIKTALSLQELVHMMISTTLQTDGHINKRAQAWCSSIGIPYFRFSPPMSEDLLLNVTDDIEVVNGMWETKAYMHALSPYLDSLVRTLELIEKSKSH